jgi:DNA invertase Pin-like site-specific DNA recombinase
MAAEYVRMSTDQQQYSLDNQSDAIREYAKRNNMVIVQTYTDAGKTGLTLTERPGLKQLLADVETGSPGYSAVLVYDISRWGRFQDADESAYYEYRCRRARIAVHYCAEMFPNDGSVTAALFKALKRAMAAEYSRELSVKVFAGKARLTELGFRQGGLAGYGVRRLLVDQDGKAKFVLKEGEEKSIATDRVVLIPGPPEETETVRKIFQMYASKRYSPADIARRLNERGVPWIGERLWTRYVIRDMVTNPKYIGTIVSNRRSGKLRARRSWNPREMWIRRDNAFEAIVPLELYKRAEAVAARRVRDYSDEQLLDDLRKFVKKHGTVTVGMIRADVNMPCPQSYNARFGTLVEAYRRIGFTPTRNIDHFDRDRPVRAVRRDFTTTVMNELKGLGAKVVQNSRTKLLSVNGTLTIRLVVAPCRPLRDECKSDGWLLRLYSITDADVTVFARLEAGDSEFRDYFCVPRKAMPTARQVSLRPGDEWLSAHRFKDRSFLSKLVRHSKRAKPA